VTTPRLTLLLALSCAIFAGCGVKFSDPPEGTEFFKSLSVTGKMQAGASLTATVEYAQHNPVVTDIRCEIRQGKTLVKDVGTQRAPLHPAGGPDATPFPGTFSYDFVIDQPGTYKAECFTPADEDNFIIKTFTLEPGGG
jgi:hypothetical protein